MSAAHPWMKFYPRDWRGDQALRMVSLSARGLWIECLSIMHEATPYGHLVVNGTALDSGDLARLVGAPVDEVSGLREELIKAGVAIENRAGILISKRMVRDENRAKKGKKAATKRWSKDTENKGKNDAPNGSPKSEPITQKPEARSHIPEERKNPPKPPSLPADVRAVMEAAGFVVAPPDLGLIDAWKREGATMDQDILPVVAAVSKSVKARTGRAPFKLQLFDAPIREKLAADAEEIERLKGIQARYSDPPPAAVGGAR